MRVSDAGIELIKSFEGFEPVPYLDDVKIPTVGYGHVIRKGEKFLKPLTESEATELMCRDLMEFEACVSALVEVDIEQCQFDALVSFTYNLGCGKLESSTLLKKLNAGLYEEAADEMLLWNRAGGKVLNGLTRRRQAERAMFLEGC